MSTVKKVSLKKLSEFNTVWHEDSGLVFKSQKELIVIGKLVDKEIIPLTDVDVTTCEKFKFKYEITAPVEEEEEEVVEEEEEVGDEEEVGENGEVTKEVTKEEVTKEVTKEEVTKEVAKEEVTKEVAENAFEDVDNFSKTINDLTRIWKSTTNENTNKIQSLEIELDKRKREYTDLQDLYDKMKIKFDGIKQLFSL